MERLIKALRAILDEVPNSVEYSDWPELQELVEEGYAALEATEKKSIVNV